MKTPENMPNFGIQEKAESVASKEKFLENIIFKEIRDKKGKVIGFKSSSPDRKSIELSQGSDIEPGKPYKIRITNDTKPDDPLSGKLIAEVVMEGLPLTDKEWNQVEGNVNKAEVLKRKSVALGTESMGSVSIPEGDNSDEKILSELGIQPLGDEDADSIRAEKVAHDEAYEKLMGDEGSPEKVLASLRWKNLSRAMKTETALEREQDRVVEYETGIIKKMIEKQDVGQPVSIERKLLTKATEKERALDAADETLKKSSPEAWYGLNLKELKGYKEQLESGKIVETEYVRKQAEEVVKHARAGQPVFIHGHLGSGKTELAFHVARKYFQKEALIISGSKHTSPAELYGHQVLSLREVDPNESEDRYKTFLKSANDEMSRWRSVNPEAPDKEADRQFDLIKSGLQERLAYEYRSGTVSDYFMGQVYQAMEEGRPIILDEVNAIPHDVLISLNHLLTRKAGDVVRIQQNSGSEVKIKEGFGFILTGNINEGGADRYIDRQNLDPAFLSRLHLIKYDYLPQAKEGTLQEAHLGDGKGGGNELFELMVSRAMDKNGNIEIPNGELRKLWNLAKAARATEDNFSGGSINTSQFFTQGGGTKAFEYRLKEGVLSIRGIDKIITAWQNDGYRNELDYYVFTEFVNQPTKLSDKAYLYQLFKDQYGFFQGNGWEQNPDYGSKGIVSAFKVRAPENPAPKIEFLGPRQVIDTVFGKGPDRTKWPDYRKGGTSAETVNLEIEIAEKLQEFEKFEELYTTRLAKIKKRIKNFKPASPALTAQVDEGIRISMKKADEFRILLEKSAQTGDMVEIEKMRNTMDLELKTFEDSLPHEGISMKEAKEIMGVNFFGPEAIKIGFGQVIEGEIPPVPFSMEILERMKDTHQLILYADVFQSGVAGMKVNGKFIDELFENKKKDGTKLLYDTDWYKYEKFFTQESSKLRWKLVSKELIPNSTSKNYLEQTELLADHVKGLYNDISKIPKEIWDALVEWDSIKSDLGKFAELQKNIVSSDEAEWKSAADTLESLKLTQLFRESFIEWFYRTSLTERVNGEKLLPDNYSWTKSRSSDGTFVYAGDFDDDGGSVRRRIPRYSNSVMGCAFSAWKL